MSGREVQFLVSNDEVDVAFVSHKLGEKTSAPMSYPSISSTSAQEIPKLEDREYIDDPSSKASPAIY